MSIERIDRGNNIRFKKEICSRKRLIDTISGYSNGGGKWKEINWVKRTWKVCGQGLGDSEE